MTISFTRRGYIELFRDGERISRHIVAEEAYERAIEHAKEHGPGRYIVQYPDREIDVGYFIVRTSTVPDPDLTALYAGYTPTIYAAPADVGTGDGSSEANAQDFTTALANATEGAIIGLIPGTYTHVASPAYRSNVPGWHPAYSGTAGSPIVIVAKYPGAGLSTPLANANRTELRAGSGAYDGADSHPVFGANGRSYIRWIGIVCDEDNCVTKQDNGPAYIASSTGCWIKYCVIRGSLDSSFLADNHSALRIGEGTTVDTGHVATDNIFYNFSVGYQTNAAGIITYGAQDSTIERNHIYDCTTGIYIKGTGDNLNTWNYGTVSKNRIHDVDGGIRLEAVDPSNDLVVQHNLIYNFSQFAMTFAISAGAANTRNLNVSRNSLVLTESSGNGGPYMKAFTGTNVRFNDNIVAIYGTTNQAYMNAGEYSADTLTAFDYNGFYGSSAGTKWIYGATNATTIGELETAVTNSNNNQVLGSNPFVNQGAGDYTVTGGALTASSTGGPIGADYALVGPQ